VSRSTSRVTFEGSQCSSSVMCQVSDLQQLFTRAVAVTWVDARARGRR
jgi:hypothetical protein